MKKKFVTAFSALLLLTVFLSACGQKPVNGPTPDTSRQEITTKETATQKQTEKETVTEENSKNPPHTDPVSDPTRASTTFNIPVTIDFLYEPQKIVFYSDGKTQTLTKEINEDIVEEINNYLREDYKGSGWKYAAEKRMINEIKSEKYIELYYDSVQIFSTENSANERKYNHILVSLGGQYKNIIFFGKDGKYMSLPIGPLYDDDFAENILDAIFDE